MTGGGVSAGIGPAVGADAADDLAIAALALARRFNAGATLWCLAPAWPEQARHVAVEFVHPVIVGSRALPAVHVGGPALVDVLGGLVRPGDVLCAVSPAADATVTAAFRRAPAWGAVTIWIGAGPRPGSDVADHLLWSDPSTTATLAPHDGSLSLRYHMLWELTQVCFDHPGLLVDGPLMTNANDETTGFLYPFIESEERDPGPLLVDLAASARAKAVLSKQLAAATIEDTAGPVDAAARAMVERFEAGGVLYTFGNGGSSSDAASVAALFSRPPSGRPLPARCLTEDPAILTALGNDVGFDLIFARQLIAHARTGDMCIALSTSGGSRNLLVAADEARRRGVLVVAMAGYDGGMLARSPSVDHSLIVHSDSVHRIQESQAVLAMELWRSIQRILPSKTVND